LLITTTHPVDANFKSLPRPHFTNYPSKHFIIHKFENADETLTFFSARSYIIHMLSLCVLFKFLTVTAHSRGGLCHVTSMVKEKPALADISGRVEQGKEAATEHCIKKKIMVYGID
jgi:hypothetical protein